MPDRIYADAKCGLTKEQVALRLQQGYGNTQPPTITKSAGRILREHACTFFNLINLVIFLSLILVESYTNLTFMGVVLSNLLIGTIQEIRSKRTVERLSLLHAQTSRVIRDGVEEKIPCEQIVLDDILRLGLGDQVPTDSVLLEGHVEADESLLTGESNALQKGPGDALLSGSFVVSGSCLARVERVGVDSYATSLTMEAKKPRRIDSKLMRALRIIIRLAGGFVLPLGLLMFSRAYTQLGHTLQSSVEQAAASMVGMIPSGLMLLTSVSLALGVITLSRRNTLVQENYAIETLARVDMLCLDKTGTLTTGDMQVTDVRPLGGVQQEEIDRLLRDFVCALPVDNSTSRALHAQFSRPDSRQAEAVTPFSSMRKYSAAAFQTHTLYVGAPDYVCPHMPQALREEIAALAGEGYRVVLLAMGGAADGEPPLPAEKELEPTALILMMDEIRPEAKDTLRFFQEEDVHVKIISGDDPLTVVRIAKRLDLPGHEDYVDVSKLESEKEVEAAALRCNVFGRVSPYQKRVILRALQGEGHTVAMTGDGVNDLLALREADCSIALYTGSDAARQAAHMVLLTNDFSALPQAVMEGRRVINNITRTASLFLVKTIYSFLLTISSVLFAVSYPFQPIQLSLISVLTVGLPSFFLAMEPNRTRIKGNFLKNVFSQALPGAICIYIYAFISGLLGPRFGLSYIEINTLCVYLTGTAGLCVLLRVCLPLEKWRAILWFTMAALFFTACLLFSDLLGIQPPGGIPMLVMYCIMASTCYPTLILLQSVVKKALRIEKEQRRQVRRWKTRVRYLKRKIGRRWL